MTDFRLEQLKEKWKDNNETFKVFCIVHSVKKEDRNFLREEFSKFSEGRIADRLQNKSKNHIELPDKLKRILHVINK